MKANVKLADLLVWFFAFNNSPRKRNGRSEDPDGGLFMVSRLFSSVIVIIITGRLG